jgi:hypothetical protein
MLFPRFCSSAKTPLPHGDTIPRVREITKHRKTFFIKGPSFVSQLALAVNMIKEECKTCYHSIAGIQSNADCILVRKIMYEEIPDFFWA